MQRKAQEKSFGLPNNFQERLDLALSYSGLKKKELAKRVGVSPSTVSRWYTDIQPQPRTMEDIANATGVRKEWLSAGVGEMTRASGSDPPPYRVGGVGGAGVSDEQAESITRGLIGASGSGALAQYAEEWVSQAERETDRERQRALSNLARMALEELQTRAERQAKP